MLNETICYLKGRMIFKGTWLHSATVLVLVLSFTSFKNAVSFQDVFIEFHNIHFRKKWCSISFVLYISKKWNSASVMVGVHLSRIVS